MNVKDFVQKSTERTTTGSAAGKAKSATEKRRREAQNARVSTPSQDLTAENLISHQSKTNEGSRTQSAYCEDQPAQQSKTAHSLFGTDSGHADDTTALSIVPTDDRHADSSERQSCVGDADLLNAEDSPSSEKAAQDVSFTVDFPPEQVNPQPDQQTSHSRDLPRLGGSVSSYPTTTNGDFEIDSPVQASIDDDPTAFHQTRTRGWRPGSSSLTQSQNHYGARSLSLQQPGSNSNRVSTPTLDAGDNAAHIGMAIRPAGRRVSVKESSAPVKAMLPQAQQSWVPNAGQRTAHETQSSQAVHQIHSRAAQLPAAQATYGPSARPRSEELEDDDQPDIDYPVSELAKMPYEKLLKEPQDYVPGLQAFDLPPAIAKGDLPKKLAHVKDLGREKQAAFFATLKQSEWEEAGDWFIQEFSALMSAFQKSRKDKRRLGAEVEAQIHGRHKVIEARKRSIDEALVEMKSSGETVLSGTPYKKRRG